MNAVRTFMERLGELSLLPLVTDNEMGELFGKEVISALAELDRYNRQSQLCANCRNHCCLVAHCELYAPQFHQCPIHDLRPVLCRFHYCNKFQTECSSLVEEVSDIYFECLLAADRDGNPRVRLFESPPLARYCLNLVNVAAPLVSAVRDGNINPENAAKLIHSEAAKYRMTPIP
jgi:hypothetical protein